jgi:outer membrane biogenesis lipoprotein LolB
MKFVVRWSLVVAILATACRTARPPAPGEHPIAPLTATSASEALRALREERAALGGARALLRVRVTTGQETQTFRAAVDVHGDHMELTAFTPLGTTAMTVTADGDRVHVHDVINGKDWDGTAADLSRAIGIFPAGVPPAEMAWLLLGYPANGGNVDVVATPSGLSSATAGNHTVRYDPPVHPPQHVEVTGPKQKVEVTVMEVIGR